MYQKFIVNLRLRRFVVLGLIILVLFGLRHFMTPILLTFIFTLLAVRSSHFIQRFIKIPTFILALLMYLLALVGFYILVTRYANFLLNQVIHTYNSLFAFYQRQSGELKGPLQMVTNYLQSHNWQSKLENGASLILAQLQSVGSLAVSFVMSFLLSFFFMIERDKTVAFTESFFTSSYSWFFQDIAYFGKIFVDTFGVVLEVQLLIAITNTIITTIGLAFFGFAQLPTLAIMIFFLSLIPVAGVIFSCIPLALIAYSTGGIQMVVYVLILIIAVHCVEAYVLNPQFMSSRTNLPIFYTFVILLLSERLLGVWGLIVGIPIFNFFLEVLQVKVPTLKSKKKELS